jgi:hypothetical protein
MREAAARLDRASLAAGKRVSRRIAAEVIAGLVKDGTADEDFAQLGNTPSRMAPRLI